MEEKSHVLNLLSETMESLKTSNSLKLKHLSNQIVHSASIYQHTDYIVLAVLIYSLSKIVENKSKLREEKWGLFVKKINSQIFLAIKSLEEENKEKFLEYLENTRKVMEGFYNIKSVVKEVMRKASINKASKIYEHGISMEKTSKLLGITQWELSEYIGQKESASKLNRTFGARSRAEMAMEFFS